MIDSNKNEGVWLRILFIRITTLLRMDLIKAIIFQTLIPLDMVKLQIKLRLTLNI